MEHYLNQFVRAWRSVTARTVRDALSVLLLLVVVIGAGFSALTTYAHLVLFDEKRFTEELGEIFTNEDIQSVVADSFVSAAVTMAAQPVAPAGAANVETTLGIDIPPVVAELLTNPANTALLTQTLRQTHQDFLATTDNPLAANVVQQSVRADLRPIFNQTLAEVATNEDLAFLNNLTPPNDAGVITVLQRAEPGDRFFEFIDQLQDLRSSIISLIILCGITALLLSPARTRVVWAIGIGIVGMAGILAVGIYGTRALLAVQIDKTNTARAAQAIHEALLADLNGRLLDMALIGILMIVVGGISGWAWQRFGPTSPQKKPGTTP
ncbi:MAG: hypothetical protein F4138_00035 [Acidimicrobiia bacterium]|nr:hypothetical protein [Acidimicrobiia bacterium]MYC57921.1 hypothetical protein [Acidimicrobiia bacterium]MYG93375.1 hypothetical protein [Acidimicrobiia bacterium]MYI29844.1 hypothetical protein [Acidimicrobiia bacterium]